MSLGRLLPLELHGERCTVPPIVLHIGRVCPKDSAGVNGCIALGIGMDFQLEPNDTPKALKWFPVQAAVTNLNCV